MSEQPRAAEVSQALACSRSVVSRASSSASTAAACVVCAASMSARAHVHVRRPCTHAQHAGTHTARSTQHASTQARKHASTQARKRAPAQCSASRSSCSDFWPISRAASSSLRRRSAPGRGGHSRRLHPSIHLMLADTSELVRSLGPDKSDGTSSKEQVREQEHTENKNEQSKWKSKKQKEEGEHRPPSRSRITPSRCSAAHPRRVLRQTDGRNR